MYKAQIEVLEPSEYAGRFKFENFTFGTEDDPMASASGTLKASFGAQRFKAMMKAAQVPFGPMSKMAAGFVGSRLVFNIVHKTQKDGEYAGQTNDNIGNFFKVGERATGIGEMKKAGGAAAAITAAALSAPVSPTPVMPVAAVAAQVAPVQAAAPVAPVAAAIPTPPAPAAAPASAGPAVGGITAGCPICGEQVPMHAYSTHVEACIQRANRPA